MATPDLPWPPDEEVVQAIHDRYQREVVEGLSLCPFARRSREAQQLLLEQVPAMFPLLAPREYAELAPGLEGYEWGGHTFNEQHLAPLWRVAAEPSARYGAAGEAMDARTDRRSASGTQSARPGECRCCRGAGGREAGGAIAESREATSRSRAYRFESEKTGIVEDAVSGRYRIRSAASAPRCGGGPGVEGGGATTISNEPSARER